MDGMSALAVVSSALDIVETLREIRQFVQVVIDVPKQRQELLDQLDLIEIFLLNIKTIADRDSCHGATAFSDGVRRAVNNCSAKLSRLQEYIQTTQYVVKNKGRVRRTQSAIKFALKEEDIKEFQNSIHQALISLNVAVMLDSR